MGNELKTIGQSFRPVLVALPLGLLVIAMLFDFADFIGGLAFFGDVGFWNLAAGAAASGITAAVGVADQFLHPARARARSAATTYGLVHIWSVALLTLVWMARSGAEHHSVGAGLFLVETLAYVGVGIAVWRGAPLAWRGATARRTEAPAVDEATVDVSAFLLRPRSAPSPVRPEPDARAA